MQKWNRALGGALLIAGTTIGAGMLALPIITAENGFYLTLSVFVIAWLFMFASALLILEANLWFPSRINLLSMTRLTLGKSGLGVALLLYLLLLYSVNAAYITGGASLLSTALNDWLPQHSIMAVLLTLVMAAIIFFGTRIVDYSNRLLMTTLIISYIVLLGAIAPHVDITHFTIGNTQGLADTWIIVVLSFAYQFVIPSIRGYVGKEMRYLGTAIFVGSLIPLLLYIFWTGAIVGSLPLEESHGLLALRESGEPVGGLGASIRYALGVAWVGNAVAIFSLCALVTSVLGVSWSMVGLLYDITQTRDYKPLKHLLFVVITLLPPLLFALFFQRGFEMALRYAGIFVAILLGLLPALMVWSGRYHKNYAKPIHFQLPGGKISLLAMVGFSVLLVVLEIMELYGWSS